MTGPEKGGRSQLRLSLMICGQIRWRRAAGMRRLVASMARWRVAGKQAALEEVFRLAGAEREDGNSLLPFGPIRATRVDSKDDRLCSREEMGKVVAKLVF